MPTTAAPAPPAPATIRFRLPVLERAGDHGPALTPMGTPVALLDPVTKRPRNATLYAFVASYLCGRDPTVAPDLILVKPFVALTQATAPLELWPARETVVVDGTPEAIARAFPGGPTRAATVVPAAQPLFAPAAHASTPSKRTRRTR